MVGGDVPDSTRIISAGGDGGEFVGVGGMVQVWNLATAARASLPLGGHAGAVRSVAVSPDGSRIISGSYDRTVRVWDLATGTPIGALTGHTGPVDAVATAQLDGRPFVDLRQRRHDGAGVGPGHRHPRR